MFKSVLMLIYPQILVPTKQKCGNPSFYKLHSQPSQHNEKEPSIPYANAEFSMVSTSSH